ncbi:hypothetical protein QFZ82_007672 [Streptomyces sp. V4I23]|uniref:DUF4352 domain-containing protein n=1 Tax=Streptomyces sp. V4I23 TaxID=3042282 RepID=UPI0027860EF6|nr:DUF4352 domain-containing protein [Streptomyces sp. V4I23]MDQ1013187.1 hypothetical protein [Streptomyces sp. V4I23]
MAISGAVLGLITLVLSVVGAVIVFRATDELVEDLSPTETRPPSARSTVPSGELKIGATQEYQDGLKVTVSDLKTVDVSDTAEGYSGDRAFQVTVTIDNGTDQTVDTGLTTVEARDADGAELAEIFDIRSGLGSLDLSDSLPEGKKVSSPVAFDLPQASGTTVDIEVTPGFLDYDSAEWTGTVP